MTKPIVVIVALFVLACGGLAACGDNPAADGRYATHDRGQNNRP